MAPYKWRDSHIEKFLELYQAEECLWNTRCKHYKDANKRSKSYEKLRAGLGIEGLTTFDIKNKIKSIRTNYKAELKKILKSEINATEIDDIYQPKLFWFDQADAFLRSVSIGNDTTSNLYTSMNHKRDVNSPQYIDTDEIEDETLNNSDNELKENYDKNFATTIPKKGDNIENSTLIDEPFSSQMEPRIKRLKVAISSIEETVNKLQAVSNDCKEATADEFDFFSKSLACQLRKMPLERALICQEKLQSVMTQERLQQIHTSRYEQNFSNT